MVGKNICPLSESQRERDDQPYRGMFKMKKWKIFTIFDYIPYAALTIFGSIAYTALLHFLESCNNNDKRGMCSNQDIMVEDLIHH